MKPIVDSGSVVNTCDESFDASTRTVQKFPKPEFQTILGDPLEHYGVKQGVQLKDRISGNKMQIDMDITDAKRPVVSVMKGKKNTWRTLKKRM